MSNYGLKMAQTGYDVLTASDKNLAFSSAFNVFKLSLEISGSESVPTGTTIYTVNLSGVTYVGFLVFYKANDNKWHISIVDGNDTTSNIWSESWIDNGVLNIQISNNTGSTQIVAYKAFIFVEET